MDANSLISLLQDKKERRHEKVSHLGLEHQPIIYELTVAEKLEVQEEINAAEDDETKHNLVIKTVIKSMCKWDESGDVTDEHIEALKNIYSSDVIIELYRCITDFGYLGEQGISKAKKS